jgi:hypothetical protein
MRESHSWHESVTVGEEVAERMLYALRANVG